MRHLSRLKWQCRRGTLELDILLTRYLETCFENAEQLEQIEFLKLLKLEDTELFPYLMGQRVPEAVSTQHLVKKIRGLSPN
jgi:antitoxin CptB